MNRITASNRSYAGREFYSLANETKLVFYLMFAICVVIPHSLQAITGALIVLTAAMSLFSLRIGQSMSYIGICYVASVTVTCVFIFIGMQSGISTTAFLQTILIYVISPLLWFIILGAALQYLGADKIIQYLIWLSFLCCMSVALFFFLFLNYGRSSVTFFIENPNVNITAGFSGATMNVYGSLIFISAAFFSTPELIRNRTVRVLLLGSLAITALTSGRSALILACILGVVAAICFRRFDTSGSRAAGQSSGWLRNLWLILPVGAVVFLIDWQFEQIDLTVIGTLFWEKLISGGGIERLDQNAALWQGIQDANGLGAGHGVPASVQRNELYPWRYENVPLAVLFRTGVIGAAIYALPFAIYVGKSIREMADGTLTVHNKFMFAGFVGAAFAAPTNPYIESFIFQWMFILPLLSLEATRSRRAAMVRSGTRP